MEIPQPEPLARARSGLALVVQPRVHPGPGHPLVGLCQLHILPYAGRPHGSLRRPFPLPPSAHTCRTYTRPSGGASKYNLVTASRRSRSRSQIGESRRPIPARARPPNSPPASSHLPSANLEELVHRLIDFAELSPLPTPSVCGQLCGRAKARRKARRICIPNGNAISLPRAGHPAKNRAT
jgi:hypothetical protein